MVNCPTCNSQVRYIEKNQKYYCDNCKAWQNIPGPQAAKNYKLVGTITPALEYRVGPGNVLFGQPGLMLTRDPTVTMQSKTKGWEWLWAESCSPVKRYPRWNMPAAAS